ncbi:MAG: ImmA/IrrE family metallo-endopeptidase [Chlamydiae bacterium]|nr:ImmA/IrrE family metallo-endopeptidase [Chlamydiota bacterium]
MDLKKLAKRISQARKRVGLSQERVEQILGMAQKAMSRIESAERLVSTLELDKLAKLFHMSIQDFFEDKESDDEEFIIALHRATPSLEKSFKFQNEVDRCIQICKKGAFLEQILNLPLKQRSVSYSFKNPNNVLEAIRQGEQAAKEERSRFGIGKLPIFDLVELISSQGIWCASTDLPSEMSGLFLHHSSFGRAILINANHARFRQRFSYAHEYAHALFDSDHKILVSDAKNASDLIETRANAFAAAFLLPEEGISEMIKSFNKGNVSRTIFAISDLADQGVLEEKIRQSVGKQKLTSYDLALISHRFGVSYQACVYRLHSLRFLSQKQREELLEEETQAKKYLKTLNLVDEFEQVDKRSFWQKELKTYMFRLIIEAYRQEKISRGLLMELCNLVDLPAVAVLELAQNEQDNNL